MTFDEMARTNLGKLMDQPSKGGWVSKDNPEFMALAHANFVATDGQVDADGDIYYTITPNGEEYAKGPAHAHVVKDNDGRGMAKPTKTAPAQPAPGFNWDITDAAWNQPRRRGSGLKSATATPLREQWGLDTLPVGASIHIPATEDVPEPWKSYGSTIAMENKRYATATGETVERKVRGEDETKLYPVYNYSKYFVIFRAHEDDPKGPGARIKRVDPVTRA